MKYTFIFSRVLYGICLQEESTKETNLGKKTEETGFSGFGDRQTWISGLEMSLTDYVTMEKSLNL